jgi:Fe2+ transport system protein FeoA
MLNQHGNLPLAMVGPGHVVKLVKVAAGRVLCRRLAEMGLTPGVQMEVLQDQGGPLLLAVRDSRLALGRGMAHKIIVESV